MTFVHKDTLQRKHKKEWFPKSVREALDDQIRVEFTHHPAVPNINVFLCEKIRYKKEQKMFFLSI